MRTIVFFDLPVTTAGDRREYRKFRKYLIKSGFIMMQESVYSKLSLNLSGAQAVMNDIRKHKAPKGLINMLTITEKQFGRMEYVIGEYHSEIINSEERLVVL